MTIWKEIPGFPLYEASNTGLIRSNNRGRIKHILKPYTMKNGYQTCQLGRGNHFLVHRLILLTFIGECQEGCEGNHINGIKSDNSISNLEYISHRDNMVHMTRVLNKNNGESHNMSKVTEDIVRKIREIAKTGLPQKDIGKMFGISRSNTGAIIRGFLWKHVK
jgi:YesN/AraC family two-component response regulator